jgi:hypothetical protein
MNPMPSYGLLAVRLKQTEFSLTNDLLNALIRAISSVLFPFRAKFGFFPNRKE